MKLILDATVSVDFELDILTGETSEEFLKKLKSGDYVISLFGDTVVETTNMENVVANVTDKDLTQSDYDFSE